MARCSAPYGADKKRKSKKKNSRTEVSSSSESDSDVEPKRAESSSVEPEVKDISPAPVPAPIPAPAAVAAAEPSPLPAKKAKKEKKPKAAPVPAPVPAPQSDNDFAMEDAAAPVTKLASKAKPVTQTQEEFNALYLRKIAAELADDLDKVREAQDFKASSVPMLVHALKQGGSLFSVEEKRRVVSAAGN